MAHQRGRLSRGSGSRRETQWLSLPVVQTTVADSSALALSLTTAEKALRPFTIIRTHLVTLQTSDQSAASEDQFGAVGICVVSEAAEAVGVSAVPTPLSELDSDLWMVHQILFNEFQLDTAVGAESNAGRVLQIDSKAMRKVNNDQDVVVVTQGSGTGGGMVISMAGRMLIKLH